MKIEIEDKDGTLRDLLKKANIEVEEIGNLIALDTDEEEGIEALEFIDDLNLKVENMEVSLDTDKIKITNFRAPRLSGPRKLRFAIART